MGLVYVTGSQKLPIQGLQQFIYVFLTCAWSVNSKLRLDTSVCARNASPCRVVKQPPLSRLELAIVGLQTSALKNRPNLAAPLTSGPHVQFMTCSVSIRKVKRLLGQRVRCVHASAPRYNHHWDTSWVFCHHEAERFELSVENHFSKTFGNHYFSRSLTIRSLVIPWPSGYYMLI